MRYEFALLRFTDDVNLDGRGYWYQSDMKLKVGDAVLAPVGVHDKLQKATVEEVRSCEPSEVPYDVRNVKSVMTKFGIRTLSIDHVPLEEFGGVKYDHKHYTPFGRILWSQSRPEFSVGFRFYGITLILPAGEKEPLKVIESNRGGVLLCGAEGRKIFEALICLCRGQAHELLQGAEPALMERLREKLL